MDFALAISLVSLVFSLLGFGLLAYITLVLRRPPRRDADDHGA